MAAFPVKCFNCGKLIGTNTLIEEFKKCNGENVDKTLDNMKIRRPCCRSLFISYPFELERMQLMYETNRTFKRVELDLPKVYSQTTIS